MRIRKAHPGEGDALAEVYEAARKFMRTTGNHTQWTGGYPSRELIRKDIDENHLYVCLTEEDIIAGVFYFRIGNDETYDHIYEGEWLNNRPYGVVHRLASSGIRKGVGEFCLDWCLRQCGNLRIDTHRDNNVMQGIMKRNGFLYCGIIYLNDGSERLAFQKTG